MAIVPALLFIQVLAIIQVCASPAYRGSSIRVGERLSVNDMLLSPGKVFRFGFVSSEASGELNVAVGFYIGLEMSVVWTARNSSALFEASQDAQLVLEAQGLFLMDNEKPRVTVAACSSHCSVSSMKLQDNGNLLLTDANGSTVWQSFDLPGDTLLPNQILRSKQALKAGRYSLEMAKTSANLTFQAAPGWSSTSYWAWPADVSSQNHQTSTLVLNTSGVVTFTFGNASRNIYSLDFDLNVTRILKLENTGNLRVYSLSADNSTWKVVWQAMLLECEIHGTCGPFGVCTYAPTPTCICPSGFLFIDSKDHSKGCTHNGGAPQLHLSCNRSNNEHQKWVHLERTTYDGYDCVRDYTPTSLEQCKARCEKDCRCLGFVYSVNRHGTCNLKCPAPGGVIYNGYQTSSSLPVVFLKASSASGAPDEGSLDQLFSTKLNATGGTWNIEFRHKHEAFSISIPLVAALIELPVFIATGAVWWLYNRNRMKRLFQELDRINGAVTKFSYRELEIATNNFKDTLGSGGFGTVFKGVLADGKTMVAVKSLSAAVESQAVKKSALATTQAEKQFKAEVATLGRIHHINLVRLYGYCAERNRRLLVYEYMPNGSLEKILEIQNQNTPSIQHCKLCEWKTRLSIAIGIARGIAYLHEQCEEHIVHCDIKPQNILLDECFRPKVSDFGLAKLVRRDSSPNITSARGTRGYMAPEWLLDIPITPKVDVYSFGMLLLELMSGRDKFLFTPSAMGTGRWNFPVWAFQQYAEGNLKATADPRMGESFNWSQFEIVMRVAFWCIQQEPETRPSMRKVVQMLEENAPIPEPPMPDDTNHAEVLSAEVSDIYPSFAGR